MTRKVNGRMAERTGLFHDSAHANPLTVSVAAVVLAAVPLPKPGIAAEVVFSPKVNVSQSTTFSQSASLAVGPLGVVDVAWAEAGAWVLFSRSRDGGQTFSSPQIVSPSDAEVATDQIAVATTFDGRTHLTWTLFDAFGGAEIAYRRSIDGNRFSPLRIISKVDAVTSFVPSIATNGAGSVAIAWADVDLSTGETSVWLRRSGNGGALFGFRKRLAGVEPVDCPDVAMTGSQNIYVVWNQGLDPDQEIVFSRSANRGRTFTSASNISQLAEKSWCPTIAIDPTAALFAVWEEGGVTGNIQIAYARSTDGGASFGPPQILSPPDADSLCPALTAPGDGRVYVTWSTGDYFAQTVKTFLSLSSDGGITFSPPMEIPIMGGQAGCPDIASSEPERVHLVWHEGPSANAWPDIFHSVALVSLP